MTVELAGKSLLLGQRRGLAMVNTIIAFIQGADAKDSTNVDKENLFPYSVVNGSTLKFGSGKILSALTC